MLKVEEARKIVLENIKLLKKETVDLLSSINKVLAEDIYATIDLPPFDNSAMDGYAVISSDTTGAKRTNPRILKIVDEIPAGYIPERELKTGEAMRIATGAAVPKGADAVVILEATEVEKKGDFEELKIFREVEKGKNIRYKGEDVRKGELVIPKGRTIRSQEIGMLAALGIKEVEVIRAPEVAILCTGDELVDIEENLEEGKIRNTNTYLLHSLVSKYGGIPVNLGIAKDTKEEIREKINSVIVQRSTFNVQRKKFNVERITNNVERNFCCVERITNNVERTYDMLIISGGVSVGKYDFVKEVLEELGIEIKFWRVLMKPGKPVLFGMLKEFPVFGLPGNPGSSFVSFEQFVRPAILKMQGKEDRKKILRAISEEEIKKKPGRKYFLWGEVKFKDGKSFVRPAVSQSPGVLKSMVMSNCLIVLPEEISKINKGEEVEVELME